MQQYNPHCSQDFWPVQTAQITGYWPQTADERHGNPLQGNQELLVVRDRVGSPQASIA